MHRFSHHPVLGTVVEVVADGLDSAAAADLDQLLLAELVRLEAVFSVFDRGSELERWKRGELTAPGPELTAVLVDALAWHRRSGGAFNVASRPATDLWRAAERRGTRPTDAELATTAASIAEPPYDVDEEGRPHVTGDATGVDLNAIAKGWIVDRAVDAAFAAVAGGGFGVEAASVDLAVAAGGDLRHRGPTPIRVGIENPLRPYDNEPPIADVELGDAALASSGRARRGFRIDGRRYAHVLDPRTARPVDHVASVSIIADDAATADVSATVVGIEPPRVAIERADELAVACMVVAPGGERFANGRWRAMVSAG